MSQTGPGLFGEPHHPKRPRSQRPQIDEVPFVHASERLFARLLEFYDIDWDYEPQTFDLLIDADGRVTERFTPDFFLPEYDLYVELTTMAQKLVTRKNRKVRMLRERHPDVNVKIFYQRDIDNLATKLGIDIPREDFTSSG